MPSKVVRDVAEQADSSAVMNSSTSSSKSFAVAVAVVVVVVLCSSGKARVSHPAYARQFLLESLAQLLSDEKETLR